MSSAEKPTEPAMVSFKIELAGGLDMLFDSQPQLKISLPATGSSEGRPSLLMKELITHMSEVVMTDSRKSLFVLDGSIRPGIMVLINEVDWELEGEEECALVDEDEVLFVSTLHGG
ncbi:hypothetical protein BROUX41_005662 [Berkeleyomyces rouxiae]